MEKSTKKKKIIIGLISCLIIIVLLFPIRFTYKDGGSVEWKAIVYSIMNYNAYSIDEEGNDCILEGKVIKIFGIEVYDSTHYVYIEPGKDLEQESITRNKLRGNMEMRDQDGNVLITIEDVESVKVQFLNNATQNEWVVEMRFTDAGAEKFAEVTQSMIGEVLYFYAEDECIAAPVITTAITDGIVQITGFDSFEQADEIVNAIKGIGGNNDFDKNIPFHLQTQ